MTENTQTQNDRIGGRLKLARSNLGVSLLSFCDALGDDCSCQELEDYEAGRVEIPAGRLAQCARLLEMPIEFFVQDDAMIDWSGSWRLMSLFRSLDQSSQTRIMQLMADISNDIAITERT